MNNVLEKIDLTIFVCCYNEQDIITKTLQEVRNTMIHFNYSYEVLIYDDHSSDKSAEKIKQYIRENDLEPQFTLNVNDRNRGIGNNYFSAAEKGRGEYFLIIHGDSPNAAKEAIKTLNLLGKADIIIPYYETRIFRLKYNRDHRTFSRRFLSASFAYLVRLLSGSNLRYFNGLVLHKRKNVLLNRVDTYGLGFMPELLCKNLKNPEITYLEVRQTNYTAEKIGTTAFKPKSIVSVLKSLVRIFIDSFR